MTGKRKIELPSGGWATFKDPKTLRVKDRKKIIKNANNQEGLLQAISLVDGLIACLVEEWSFAEPIPSIKIQVLDELEMADYDVLAEEAGKAQSILFPAIAKTEASEADVDSPFGNSND